VRVVEGDFPVKNGMWIPHGIDVPKWK
jgi:hypothetical protein